jgi:hypothetical protein
MKSGVRTVAGAAARSEDRTMEQSGAGTPRLAILLAMAMFVLVVDTSLMNVSISAVVRDLDTTVSGVQSAIALEALVSAAFILIGNKAELALVIPLLAGLIGLYNAIRMVRLPDPTPTGSGEAMALA